jgi:hypothetical protein
MDIKVRGAYHRAKKILKGPGKKRKKKKAWWK